MGLFNAKKSHQGQYGVFLQIINHYDQNTVMINLTEFTKNAERAKKIVRNHPVDMKKSSDERILSHFRALINTHYCPRYSMDQQFYGGITKDIESNLDRHNIAMYLGCIEVDSYKTAERIERLLHDELGVFIGVRGSSSAGNGGDEDSTIVYLADRKDPNFID